MNRDRLGAVILVLAVLLGVLLRVQALPLKATVTHDEGISFLAATGHQAEFSELYETQRAPYGRWVEASRWKRYLERDRFWCFRKIASDIAHTDIHPPLYFWMLHVWLWVVGVHVWSGAAMNVFITLAMILVLYRFARYVLDERLGAAVVVFTWAVSPHIMEESLEARAYGLLAVFALLLVWRTIAVVESGRVRGRDMLVVALVTAAGSLTHYHFAIAAAGAALYAGYRLLPRLHDWAPFARLMAAMAAGVALFAAAHPAFYHSFSTQQSQAQRFDPAALPARALKSVHALSDYFVHPHFGTAVAVAVVLLVGVALSRALRRRGTLDGAGDDRARAVVFFFLWIAGAIVLLYLGFVSPVHAMGPKYLSMAWPFFVFVPVLAARHFSPRRVPAILVGLCVWQTAYASGAVALARYHAANDPSQRAVLAGADRVVVDSVARGVLPRVLFNLSDTVPVYAGMQSYLLEHPAQWSDALDDGAVYVNHNGYGNSTEGRDEILRIVETRHAVSRARGDITGFGLYRIR